VKLLLEYGHQVDCLDSWGWPPLLYANFAAQESCVISLMEPDPKQIFVLGDLLNRGKSEAARERNFKVRINNFTNELILFHCLNTSLIG
jgi:hypothetical protein